MDFYFYFINLFHMLLTTLIIVSFLQVYFTIFFYDLKHLQCNASSHGVSAACEIHCLSLEHPFLQQFGANRVRVHLCFQMICYKPTIHYNLFPPTIFFKFIIISFSETCLNEMS